jgi:hypothetical protein
MLIVMDNTLNAWRIYYRYYLQRNWSIDGLAGVNDFWGDQAHISKLIFYYMRNNAKWWKHIFKTEEYWGAMYQFKFSRPSL